MKAQEPIERVPRAPVRLRIPWDAARTSSNRLRALHWAQAARVTRAAKAIARAEWIHAGEPRFERRVMISGTVYMGRVIDPDNLVRGLKPILDGLCFAGGIVPDDSARWVVLGAFRQVTGKRFRGQEVVELEISEAE